MDRCVWGPGIEQERDGRNAEVAGRGVEGRGNRGVEIDEKREIVSAGSFLHLFSYSISSPFCVPSHVASASQYTIFSNPETTPCAPDGIIVDSIKLLLLNLCF